MEYVSNINICEAVVHVLDSNSSEPILNEYKVELDEDTYRFLFKHIDKCLKDEELKYAKFNMGLADVNELVQDYFRGKENDLIGLSKELAKSLFSILKANENISSCDLIVASILTDKGPMIAILKLDYTKSFTHKIEFINDEVGINIVKQVAALPGSGQKIHKAAFIKKEYEEESSFNIMVLDKKVKAKSEEEEYGAKYWMNNFLDASIVVNERDQTKEFIKFGEQWIRENYSDHVIESEEIRKAMRNKLENEEVINIDEFAKEVFKDSGALDSFKMFMTSRCDENIKIDEKYVDKKLNKIKLKINNNIQLQMDKDTYNDKTKFEIVKNQDGIVNMIIKNVKECLDQI